jgi:hypothetical protein
VTYSHDKTGVSPHWDERFAKDDKREARVQRGSLFQGPAQQRRSCRLDKGEHTSTSWDIKMGDIGGVRGLVDARGPRIYGLG